MEEKSTKKFNLSQYSAVAGAIIAGGGVNAQIVYNDISPDRVIDKNSPNADNVVDFNADATPDLLLVAASTSNAYTSYGVVVKQDFAIALAPVANGFLGTASTGGSVTPTLLMNGNDIGPTGVFGNNPLASPYSAFGSGFLASAGVVSYTASASYNYGWTSGNFVNTTNAYLGMKFKIGTATHYGWVRFDVSADSKTITLKDHAYNTVANQGMLAGQMLNLDNVAVENKVTIKTHLDEAFINVTPDLIGGEMVIINMAGQEVKSSVIGDVNAKMTYEGLDSGIYTLVARFESGSVNKKIYVR